MPQVRLKPATPESRVKNTTTGLVTALPYSLIWTKTVLHSDVRYLYDFLKMFKELISKKNRRQQKAYIINQHALELFYIVLQNLYFCEVHKTDINLCDIDIHNNHNLDSAKKPSYSGQFYHQEI